MNHMMKYHMSGYIEKESDEVPHEWIYRNRIQGPV
jgi:hypothetical protein